MKHNNTCHRWENKGGRGQSGDLEGSDWGRWVFVWFFNLGKVVHTSCGNVTARLDGACATVDPGTTMNLFKRTTAATHGSKSGLNQIGTPFVPRRLRCQLSGNCSYCSWAAYLSTCASRKLGDDEKKTWVEKSTTVEIED